MLKKSADDVGVTVLRGVIAEDRDCSSEGIVLVIMNAELWRGLISKCIMH